MSTIRDDCPYRLAAAARIAPGADGLTLKQLNRLVPGGEWFDHRRPHHGRGHEVRAILEATAGVPCQQLRNLSPEKGIGQVYSAGGAARSALWREIKSIILNAEIIASTCAELACLWAAILAVRSYSGDTLEISITRMGRHYLNEDTH